MYNGSDFGYANGDLAINLPSGSVTKVVGANLNERIVATPQGITKIALSNQDSPSTGMTNFIASDYSTGWQVGDIKLATLSDTSATNVTGGTQPDRSVNNNALNVTGTITKTAVATGAHLVAYSGFNASNKLKQPYYSGLDFNLGNFSICFWTNNPSSATEYVLDRADTNGNYRIAIYLTGANSGTVNLYTVDGSSGSSATAAIIGTPNKWAQVWINRVGNLHETWVNGILKVSTSLGVRDVSSGNGQAQLCIGARYSNANHNTGKLALVRISATIPSQEHILKSYNDEKRLFQPNAKAAFYGNSDAVTALAYDDSTDLLHVGTSEGRTVYQGLQRVGNSTTAVGAAISASNSLVAEE